MKVSAKELLMYLHDLGGPKYAYFSNRFGKLRYKNELCNPQVEIVTTLIYHDEDGLPLGLILGETTRLYNTHGQVLRADYKPDIELPNLKDFGPALANRHEIGCFGIQCNLLLATTTVRQIHPSWYGFFNPRVCTGHIAARLLYGQRPDSFVCAGCGAIKSWCECDNSRAVCGLR